MGVWSFLGVSHEYSAKNSRYVHIMLNYYISAPVSGFTARHETHRFALLCRQEVFESAKPAGAGLPWDPHQCQCRLVFQDQRRMGAVTPGDTVPYTTSTSVLKLVTSLRRDEIAITLLMLSLGFARKSGIFSRILGA